jgi:hypothetical protein
MIKMKRPLVMLLILGLSVTLAAPAICAEEKKPGLDEYSCLRFLET